MMADASPQLQPNRSDLATQAAQAPKGQQYGQAGAQIASQQQQPIAGASTSGTSGSASGGLPGLGPGEIPTLADPSAFPDEPLTAGLPSGAGPGTEALNTASFGPEELSVLRGIFQRYPNDDLRRLIEWTESNLA